MLQIDHIMYGVRDLDAGVNEIEDRTGVRAVFGGFHPGNGTCNALVSLGDTRYLEIIAPDPEQGLGGTLGESLIAQRGPRIRTWAVAAPDLEDIAGKLQAFGMESRIEEMSRTRPDGVELRWRLLFASSHEFGDFMPFFIDWQDSPHPSADAPGGCELESFDITVESGMDLQGVMADLDIAVGVKEGAARTMTATLNTPRGLVQLVNQ